MEESRGVWLEHLQRVLEHSEGQQARLSPEDHREIARELGISDADLQAAHASAEDHHQRGQGYFDERMWSDAIEELEHAMALHPERVEIVTLRAQAHLQRHLADHEPDDAAQARRCARFALQHDPDNETAFAVLARLDAATREQATRRTRRTMLIIGASVLAGVVALVLSGGGDDLPQDAASAPTDPPPKAETRRPPSSVADAPQTDPGCPEGMVFASGKGCFAPTVVMEPGVGVAGIRIGQSTVDDVLDTLGRDARLDRYDGGEVFAINYLYDDDEKYDPRRTANLTRPTQIKFDDGVVSRISAGAESKALRTPGGLTTTTSTRDDMRAELGDHYVLEHGEVLDIYRYEIHGVEVWVHRENQRVNSIHLIPRG